MGDRERLDLCGIPVESVNDDRLYRALDKVGEHKDRLCAHLMERYRQWFGVRFEFLLYDVTSTYFEGLAEKNTKAARGYSRDQRSDCKQVAAISNSNATLPSFSTVC